MNGKWQIAKEFGCDYGHRVWTQQLNEEYSCDSKCVCRHLHGHRATIIVYLESDELDKQGMVTDFKHLNWFKEFIDRVIDHKFIIDINDPLLKSGIFLNNVRRVKEDIDGDAYYEVVAPHEYENIDNSVYELYEGMVFVDFVPTSENLSKWFFEIIQRKMNKIGVKVQRVQFYETPKSQSNFIKN